MIRSFVNLLKNKNKRAFAASLKLIIGYTPRNTHIYKLALSHSTLLHPNQHQKESNQRLEYLGDAILGAIVAEYLFKKFPYKEEGFLTDIRSRLVNREVLNGLAVKIGLSKMIQSLFKMPVPTRTVYGDTLEALIAAIYLDKGFQASKKFVLTKLLPHYDIEEVVQTNSNYKSIVIEWAQKSAKKIRFEIIEEVSIGIKKEFTAQVVVEEEPVCIGKGLTKKKAEQAAALKACELLRIM